MSLPVAPDALAQGALGRDDAPELVRLLDDADGLLTPALLVHRKVERELEHVTGRAVQRRDAPPVGTFDRDGSTGLRDLLVEIDRASHLVAARAAVKRRSDWVDSTIRRMSWGAPPDVVQVVVVPKRALAEPRRSSTWLGREVWVVRLDVLRQGQGLGALADQDPEGQDHRRRVGAGGDLELGPRPGLPRTREDASPSRRGGVRGRRRRG